ncbi:MULTISPECIES: hypothetical protein [unclassified Bosea (in: a-proteobacteria)]|uniref:hypothetical protein n=1 Tax=unclassified Bosea (in: a-proteobacteria) TaxID=2653178 RepID=UPI000F758D7B|nr:MULTISPECIES: hypothetical protein [unclassified Bosea (in: a-proteobacteria)]AZO79942.1 hypothetical protein BLM15_21860 [Bosea sp. Tri-49]RXT22719.1 hypothetical protein B5U98_08650 [Bosea sp. Tri-39]RXT38187.1 hypothetical protein B5U99_08100 [Bosea sp. Tri-54]
MAGCDILISGTGGFAARIAFDIAATADEPVEVIIAGRNRERLNWLRTAANARSALFGKKARFTTHAVDLLAPNASDEMLAATAPRIAVQAASIQTSQVIAQSGNAWTQLVAEGGLSATAVFQALLSSRVAAAITRSGKPVTLVNCGFPDVVNGMIRAMGHDVACGMGNVAILSNVFAGSAATPPGAKVKVLAHYQNLAAWRRRPEERSGRAPRVWLDGIEVEDVYGRFADIQLTPEPVIEISGASGVPMLLAMAANRSWRGHVPGPNGLPGGYPVWLTDGTLELDLPDGVAQAEAIAWNASFEEENGLVVSPEGKVSFTGLLGDRLADHIPALRDGFAVRELEAVCEELLQLRSALMKR